MRSPVVTIVLVLLALLPLAPGPAPVLAGDNVPPRADYAAIAEQLTTFIRHELSDKQIPAMSIALVDGQETVWATGFGIAVEPATAASAETVYRVGSVSKLFTDIGIMQLVERGELELDAPIQTYLPELQPTNPFDEPFTLRMLMSHRAGLVREPPVGHYFDNSGTTLAATIAAMNGTTLVYPPGDRTKYSNAGIAIVGYLLEHRSGTPFAEYVKQHVLVPLGLESSAFEPTPALDRRLATGWMWSYDGRLFPAPPIQLGMAPAGSMYSTVTDLARFMHFVFARGTEPESPVLRRATLEQMLRPQFAAEGQRSGYGIGFRISESDDGLVYGHNGAIYGFATHLSFLYEQNLGVAVTSNVDVTNTVASRVGANALRLMADKRVGRESAAIPTPGPVDFDLARLADGNYRSANGERLELVERDGQLFAWIGQARARLRSTDDGLITDGRLGFGTAIRILDRDRIRIEEVEYTRTRSERAAPAPRSFAGLLGEYGWDHNVLFVLERAGKLNVLIEWTELDELQSTDDGNFTFTAGMYEGESVRFEHDKGGEEGDELRATAAIVAGIRFPRRTLESAGMATFHIEPVAPIEQLRRQALAAHPPVERGEFRDTDLVDVTAIDPSIKLDIRYAGTDNFMQTPFYEEARAFLQRPAALALARANRWLATRGYGLLIHDAYRPWHVTKMFWDATPADKKRFVADPARGSRHNRGCAVDLTLYDLATGAAVETTGLYDEMTERSYPDYVGGTSLERWHRELLRDAMEAEGFRVYEFEWWHFDYDDWQYYAIGARTFAEIDSAILD